MVTNISPSYYAENVTVTGYDLTGKGFPGIPDDAVGVLAYDNNNPEQYKTTQSNYNLYKITAKTKETLNLEQVEVAPHSQPNYLGCIVSADRQTTYWVNDTKPLP